MIHSSCRGIRRSPSGGMSAASLRLSLPTHPLPSSALVEPGQQLARAVGCPSSGDELLAVVARRFHEAPAFRFDPYDEIEPAAVVRNADRELVRPGFGSGVDRARIRSRARAGHVVALHIV